MADESPTPTPTPGGENPSYVEKGGKECEDENYFISVCETGFVDPVLRHTIVEAAATVADCEVCVTAAEIRAAVDAINALLEEMADAQKIAGKSADSSYGCSGGGDESHSSTGYEDVTNWGEDSSNSDFSLAAGTEITVNTGGTCRVNCGLSVRSSSGGSSCSTRVVVDTGSGYGSIIEKSSATSVTSTTISMIKVLDVNPGDKFKIQIKNNEDIDHIVDSESTWLMQLFLT